MSGKNYPSSTINRRKQGDGGPPGKRRNVPAEKILNVRRTAQLRSAESSIAGIIFVSLLAFRIFNALAIRTFFQPDEYYQALEPAWKLAAGPDSGAWITWVSLSIFIHSHIHLSVPLLQFDVTDYLLSLLEKYFCYSWMLSG